MGYLIPHPSGHFVPREPKVPGVLEANGATRSQGYNVLQVGTVKLVLVGNYILQ